MNHIRMPCLPVLVYYARVCVSKHGQFPCYADPLTPRQYLMIRRPNLLTQTRRLETTNLPHLPIVALLHQIAHILVFLPLNLETTLLADHIVASAVVLRCQLSAR